MQAVRDKPHSIEEQCSCGHPECYEENSYSEYPNDQGE